MIASVLVFLLGAFVATLAALLLAPVLWRKAQDFARREFEATLPATANEIRAEFDVVRAAAAMAVRRGEVDVAAMRERVARAQAEVGRAAVEIAALGKRNRDGEAKMAAFAAERDNLREIFAAHRDKERALAETLDEAKRDGSLNAEELEALATRFRETSELAEGRQIELVAAQTRIERLTDALRSVERASAEKDTLIRLLRREAERASDGGADDGARRAPAGLVPGMPGSHAAKPVAEVSPTATAGAGGSALAATGFDGALARWREGTAPDEREAAALRERLAAFAAQTLHDAAVREGPGSPLAPLLRPAPGEDATEGPDRSLAGRVRDLAGSQGSGTPRAE